ncbi:MAG: hypothetical protein AAF633_19445, partial [Chloroflexota bacterium]
TRYDGTASGSGASSQPDLASPSSFEHNVAFASVAGDLIPPTGNCYFGNDTNGARDIFFWETGDGNRKIRPSSFWFSIDTPCEEPDQNAHAPAVSTSSGSPQIVYHTFAQIPTAQVLDNNSSADVMGSDPYSSIYSDHFIGDFPFTGDDGSFLPDISADGTTVVFETDATDLVDNDTNGETDILLKREGADLKRISVSSSEAQTSGGGSFHVAASRFGEHIVFSSDASDLTLLDADGHRQVYLRDEAAGCTLPISIDGDGGMGNGESDYPSVSADGRFVAFHSAATNLVEEDTNDRYDIFRLDRDTDRDGSFYSNESLCLAGPSAMRRVSVASDGTQSNGNAFLPDISGNGEFVTFHSDASNLIEDDSNSVRDVFVHFIGFNVELNFSAPTPTETPTPAPTGTLSSTETPSPTATPNPMDTPSPTATPAASETPDPLATLFLIYLPWMQNN